MSRSGDTSRTIIAARKDDFRACPLSVVIVLAPS
jgi:hypothetical protein